VFVFGVVLRNKFKIYKIMESKELKEERSEYVSVYVTPTLKKEFELAKDNQTLKETILKQYLTNEKDWLKDELKEIDEATVKYSAKLIGIKESFGKCQDSYVEEIESIYNKANETFKKLNSVAEETRKSIDYTRNNLTSVLTQISNIDFHKIDRMLELINKVNSMSSTEIEMVKKLIS
jgi:methyl-accepting chemotaxis protein